MTVGDVAVIVIILLSFILFIICLKAMIDGNKHGLKRSLDGKYVVGVYEPKTNEVVEYTCTSFRIDGDGIILRDDENKVMWICPKFEYLKFEFNK